MSTTFYLSDVQATTFPQPRSLQARGAPLVIELAVLQNFSTYSASKTLHRRLYCPLADITASFGSHEETIACHQGKINFQDACICILLTQTLLASCRQRLGIVRTKSLANSHSAVPSVTVPCMRPSWTANSNSCRCMGCIVPLPFEAALSSRRSLLHATPSSAHQED